MSDAEAKSRAYLAHDITVDDATCGLPILRLFREGIDTEPVTVCLSAQACAMLAPIFAGIGESAKVTGWGEDSGLKPGPRAVAR